MINTLYFIIKGLFVSILGGSNGSVEWELDRLRGMIGEHDIAILTNGMQPKSPCSFPESSPTTEQLLYAKAN